MKPDFEFEFSNLDYDSKLPDWSIPGNYGNYIKIRLHGFVRTELIYLPLKYGVIAVYR